MPMYGQYEVEPASVRCPKSHDSRGLTANQGACEFARRPALARGFAAARVGAQGSARQAGGDGRGACLVDVVVVIIVVDAAHSPRKQQFLQYGSIPGYPVFRNALAGFLSKRCARTHVKQKNTNKRTHDYSYGQTVSPDLLMATNGISGALALILSLFTKSGDLVFAEEPTYFLAKSIFNDFKLVCKQIPQDEQGLDVDALEKRLAAGEVPVLLYVVPTAHNPSGRTLIPSRRAKLVELSVKYKFILLADEVYQLLTFPHVQAPPPMFTYDKHGTVLCLGSFSKILAPGIRVGWIQGSKELLKKIFDCGQLDSSGGLNPFGYGVCEKAITLGLLDEHVDFARAELFRRYTALSDGLKKHLPEGVTFEQPQGGYFCIVRLPDGFKAADLLPIAREEYKVAFLPGSAFSQTMVRLSAAPALAKS